MENPALRDLAPLVGRWSTHLSNASFLDDGATIDGEATFEWLDGGALLVMRSSMAADLPPATVWVFGRNEDVDDYTVLAADARGVSRVYGMTFVDRRWTAFRADPGFHQRFEATVEDDRITGSWSRSHDDGATWIHDFDLLYTRRA